jgi:predicted permease
VAPNQPWWIRVLVRIAGRRASEAELGDVVEEYVAAGRSLFWFTRQLISIVRRRRSPLTTPERGSEMLTNLRNDIRYALRTLGRNPGFALAVILPIALGIGLNTAVFAVINSVAWRALPVSDPDALVSVYQDFRGGPRRSVYGARALLSIPEYRAYRDESHTLSGVMAFTRQWTVTLGRDQPQEIGGVLVTCNYFDVLRVPLVVGAGFTSANCGAPDAPPSVVLSQALWKAAFGADPHVLDKPIVMNGREVAVVGVAPPGFDGVDMAKAAFFAPTPMLPVFYPERTFHDNPNVSWLTVMARRRADADLAHTRADLSVIAARIDQQQPGRTTSLIVEPAATLSLPVARREMLRASSIVIAAFGLVLLTAAANVANILLARAAGRKREVAIRLSVGATRGRLIQQLLTESAIIAIVGGVAGSVLFSWSFQAAIPRLLALVPGADITRIDATPDRLVLWFALGLTALTASVFGVVPALQASAADHHAVMKQDAGSDTKRGWMRGTLIGAQVALCMTLLIPAALLSRALYVAHTFDPGFSDQNVTMIAIDLRGPRYEKANAAIFLEQWLERVRTLPGVERVALASRTPLSPGRTQNTIRIGDETEPRVVDMNSVSPEFFSLLGIPIVHGRVFTEGEVDAVLVTESTARRYWPGQDAVSQVIIMDGRRRTIVGIVRDARVSQSPDAISSYVYLPAVRDGQRQISVLVRTRTGVDGLAAAVRAATAGMDNTLIANVQPLSANLALLQTLSQMVAGIAGTVSLLALTLAAIGVYGVVAYVVSRRRREVGVRIALGADVRDVQRLILRQTLRPVAVGMTLGLAAAAASVRLLQSALFGVSPYDPIAFIAAPLLMLGIAAAAAFLPTRQATRIDPMVVLRTE